jgi:hypothetical protein
MPKSPFASAAALAPLGGEHPPSDGAAHEAGPAAAAQPGRDTAVPPDALSPVLPPPPALAWGDGAGLAPPFAGQAEGPGGAHAGGGNVRWQEEEEARLEQQRSLLFDEAPQEVYAERLRASTYSFVLNLEGSGSGGLLGRLGARMRRRRGGVDDSEGGSAASRARGAPPPAARRRQLGATATAAAAAAAHSDDEADGGEGEGDAGWEPFGGGAAAAQAPLVRSILPQLARARALLPAARAEPPWLVAGGGAAAGAGGGHHLWEEMIDAAERLAMRCWPVGLVCCGFDSIVLDPIRPARVALALRGAPDVAAAAADHCLSCLQVRGAGGHRPGGPADAASPGR